MRTLPINSCPFEAKNTYLSQAVNAATRSDRKRFLSYHCEAKARVHYRKFLQESSRLKNLSGKAGGFGLKDLLELVVILPKMVYRKLASGINMVDAYDLYPERFYYKN